VADLYVFASAMHAIEIHRPKKVSASSLPSTNSRFFPSLSPTLSSCSETFPVVT
jgi:hypothetical protein